MEGSGFIAWLDLEPVLHCWSETGEIKLFWLQPQLSIPLRSGSIILCSDGIHVVFLGLDPLFFSLMGSIRPYIPFLILSVVKKTTSCCNFKTDCNFKTYTIKRKYKTEYIRLRMNLSDESSDYPLFEDPPFDF